MPLLSQRFGHDVCQHNVGRAVLQLDRSTFDNVAYELKLDIEMLRSCMVNWVLGQCNGALVVDVDHSWCILHHSKVFEEVLEPDSLLGSLRKGCILSLSR